MWKFMSKKLTYWWTVKCGQIIYTFRIYGRNETSPNITCIFPPLSLTMKTHGLTKTDGIYLSQDHRAFFLTHRPILQSPTSGSNCCQISSSNFVICLFPFPFPYCTHNFNTTQPSPSPRVVAYLRFTHWIKIQTSFCRSLYPGFPTNLCFPSQIQWSIVVWNDVY